MKCRVCSEETEPFVSIASDSLEEPFLDAELRQQLPELRLRRCRECGCLWADDARQDEATLVAAYERVSDSYFEPTENDLRYQQFYKWLEQLLKQHVSGRTVLDVGCGDGAFLSTLSDEWSKHGVEPSASGARLAPTMRRTPGARQRRPPDRGSPAPTGPGRRCRPLLLPAMRLRARSNAPTLLPETRSRITARR